MAGALQAFAGLPVAVSNVREVDIAGARALLTRAVHCVPEVTVGATARIFFADL